MTREQVVSVIDHTLLKPDATPEQISLLCGEAREYGFKTVCVNSRFVAQCDRELSGSQVGVCSVVGFPLGAMSTPAKVAECLQAVSDGATEIDMVLWVGGLISGEHKEVEHDIRAVEDACRRMGAKFKVIFETARLSDEQIVTACKLSVNAGAQWVKTSTGFGPGGATLEAVRLMHREVAGHGLKVKASGGIRSLADLQKFVDAGAERIGSSSGAAIVKEIATK